MIGKRAFSLRKKDTAAGDGANNRSFTSSRIPDELFNENVGLNEPLFQYETLIESDEVKSDPMFSELCVFPADDIKLEKEERESDLAESEIPNLPKRGTKDYINQCIGFFNSGITKVTKNYTGQGPLAAQAIEENKRYQKTLSEHRFRDMEAVGLANGNASKAEQKPRPVPAGVDPSKDTLHPMREEQKSDKRNRRAQLAVSGVEDPFNIEILNYDPETTDKKNAEARQQNRAKLFHLFSGAEKYLTVSRAETSYPFYSPPEPTQFLITPKELEFELGGFEPFFCTLAIFDITKKKRVSGEFAFQLNKPEVLNLLSSKDSVPELRKALFSVTNPSNDLFVIVRIEKILQGEIDTVTDYYIRHDALKSKEHEKAIATATAACTRSTYRQPFAWSMAPLFHEDRSPVEGDITFPVMYKQREAELSDAFFLQMLQEFSKTGSAKRSKIIPGKLRINFKVVDPEGKPLKGRLTPSLHPRKPTSSKSVIQEIEEFPTKPILVPVLNYVNDFYLYLSSVNLSGRTGSPTAKNIAVSVKYMENDDSRDAPGLPVFYTPGRTVISTSQVSTVVYHNKAPQFYNEIRIALPPVLSEQHHLLFTFYHLNIQQVKGKSLPLEVPVAYAVWPIYDNERVVTKDTLPVYAELPERDYLADTTNCKFIDNKKPLFALKGKLHSTIYSQDVQLNNAFKRMKKVSATSSTCVKAAESLLRVHPVRIIKYFPVMMNYILQAICSNEENGYKCFHVIPSILSGIYEESPDAKSILGAYVDNVFNTYNGISMTVHEALTKFMLQYLRDAEKECEIVMKFAWFFFKLIHKSMVLHLDGMDKSIPLRERYPTSFLVNLRGLLVILTWEVQQRSQTALTLGKELTRSVASFLCDLFGLIEKGVVFKMIEKFAAEIAENDNDLTLTDYKFEFLKVFIEYEHFIPLNIPVLVSFSKPAEIVPAFKSRHFLISVIVEHVSHYMMSKSENTYLKGMDVLRKVLISLEYDHRYSEDPAKMTRIVSLFFPILQSMIDHPIPKQAVFEERRDFLICLLFILKHTDKCLFKQWFSKESKHRLVKFFELMYLAMSTFEYVGEAKFLELTKDGSKAKSSDSMKAMLENYYSGVGSTTRTGSQPGTPEMRQFRRFASAKANSAERVPSGTHSNPIEVPDMELDVAEEPSRRSFANKKATLTRKTGESVKKNSGTAPTNEVFNSVLESNLSNEASFIILDTFEVFLECVASSQKKLHRSVAKKVLTMIIKLLQLNHTEAFLPHVYATLRSFTMRFYQLLFADTEVLGEYCYAILGHCNTEVTKNRTAGSGLVFLLMKQYFLAHPDIFPRITVQLTIAMSKLVGSGLETDAYLRRTIGSVTRMAAVAFDDSKDDEKAKQFAKGVDQLMERLYGILRDYMKISMYAYDDEMTMDLYHRLADGYTNAPSLRMTWLESLGNFHRKKENWAEYAMCSLHIASMIAEYLYAVGHVEGRPEGSAAFSRISKNIGEEATVKETSAVTEVESPERHTFTEENLIKYMRHALDQLKKGDLFETANEVYKLLLAIYEKNLLYHHIASSHGDLQMMFEAIIDSEMTQSRMLGSYYRVGFYGSGFAELDGKEFIYKEPKITKLMEIKERLINMYEDQFGKGNFEIISHSNNVSPSDLQSGKAYVQLTSVEPYFPPEEMGKRKTYFMRYNDINKFEFKTPFTKSGKAQTENVAEQFMRRTILTTNRFFPYMKTRLLVVDKHETIQTPIETAIEAIKQRTLRIREEINSESTSLKTLQPVLSGSVCLQVNAGPLEFSNTFFSEQSIKEIPDEHLRLFKEALKGFLTACREGVAKHETMVVTESDLAFHMSLVEGLMDVTKQMKEHTGRYKDQQKETGAKKK